MEILKSSTSYFGCKVLLFWLKYLIWKYCTWTVFCL